MASGGLAEAGKLLQALRSAFQSGDVATCQKHLGQLKVSGTCFGFLLLTNCAMLLESMDLEVWI
jgi:hypothetical protein